MKETKSYSKICKIDLAKLSFEKWPKGQLMADFRLLEKHDWQLGTHTSVGVWSEQTVNCLTALMDSMENDAAKVMFDDNPFILENGETPYDEMITHEQNAPDEEEISGISDIEQNY